MTSSEVALLIERSADRRALGYEVPVFLRSTKEIQAIAAFATV